MLVTPTIDQPCSVHACSFSASMDINDSLFIPFAVAPPKLFIPFNITADRSFSSPSELSEPIISVSILLFAILLVPFAILLSAILLLPFAILLFLDFNGCTK